MQLTRPLLLACSLGLALTVGGASGASAATADGLLFGDNKDFCAGVQAVTGSLTSAQIDDMGGITNVVQSTEQAMLNSKSSSVPLVTHQFTVTTAAGDTIFCKGRSTDALNDEQGAGSAGAEQECGVVIGRQVANAWSKLTQAEQDAADIKPADVVIDPDDNVASGPAWANFNPPFTTFRLEGGQPHFQAQSLVVPWQPNAAPDLKPFYGNHYCTLPSNSSVAKALAWVAAPVASASPTATVDDETKRPQKDKDNDPTPPASPDSGSTDGGTDGDAPVLAATGASTDALLPASALLLLLGTVLVTVTRRRWTQASHQ